MLCRRTEDVLKDKPIEIHGNLIFLKRRKAQFFLCLHKAESSNSFSCFTTIGSSYWIESGKINNTCITPKLDKSSLSCVAHLHPERAPPPLPSYFTWKRSLSLNLGISTIKLIRSLVRAPFHWKALFVFQTSFILTSGYYRYSLVQKRKELESAECVDYKRIVEKGERRRN